MATTNHVVIANYPSVSSTLFFNHYWKLTRALLKAGWKYIASGNGTSKDTSGDPALDLWKNTTVTTNAGGTASLTIGTLSRGRHSVTGLSGITSADKGRFLVISGSGNAANNHWHQIEEYVSSSSVKISGHDAFTLVAETASLTWSIADSSQEAYLSSLASATSWWCARGPSTLKIPITAAPVAGGSGFNFIRGENIVQASTGAEGEIIGWVFASGAGYLVVAPRFRGTGSGVYGWQTGNAITGSLTGATVTHNGTALEYRHELVIWKANNETSGSIFHGNAEPVGDVTFDSLKGTAGCTATIAPGGGGTGNTFPTFAWLAWGSTTSNSHAIWNGTAAAGNNPLGNAQIVCADCIEEQNYSADGSWTCASAVTSIAGAAHIAHGFYRLDDGEDGDLDPYISFSPGGQTTLYGNTRTTGMTGAAASNLDYTTSATFSNNSTAFVAFRGWRKRGLSGDAATNSQDFECFVDKAGQSNLEPMKANNATPAIVATDPSTTPVKVREPMRVGSVQASRKMHKGVLRWASFIEGGNGTDTYDTKRYLQLSPNNGGMIVGPWDGTSTPSAT